MTLSEDFKKINQVHSLPVRPQTSTQGSPCVTVTDPSMFLPVASQLPKKTPLTSKSHFCTKILHTLSFPFAPCILMTGPTWEKKRMHNLSISFLCALDSKLCCVALPLLKDHQASTRELKDLMEIINSGINPQRLHHCSSCY